MVRRCGRHRRGVVRDERRWSRRCGGADALEHLLQPLPLGLEPRLLVTQLRLLGLEALDGVLERLVRALELLGLGAQLAQETGGVAQDGDLVGPRRLAGLQDRAELVEPFIEPVSPELFAASLGARRCARFWTRSAGRRTKGKLGSWVSTKQKRS
jgi:hypothetical protein